MVVSISKTTAENKIKSQKTFKTSWTVFIQGALPYSILVHYNARTWRCSGTLSALSIKLSTLRRAICERNWKHCSAITNPVRRGNYHSLHLPPHPPKSINYSCVTTMITKTKSSAKMLPSSNMQSSSTHNAGIPNPLAKEKSSLHHPYGERK